MVVIQVVGRADGRVCPQDGLYLAAGDPATVQSHDGFDWTSDPMGGLRFDSIGEALTYWSRQSTVRPLREDGQPNKPLTAWTVELRTFA